MNAYILIVVILNSTFSGGQYSQRHDAPAVTMQEFGSEKACLFARTVVLRRAGEMASKIDAVCVPKDQP